MGLFGTLATRIPQSVRALIGIAAFVLLVFGAVVLVAFVLIGDQAGRVAGAVAVATAAVALLGWLAPRLLPWSGPSAIQRIATRVDEITERYAEEAAWREAKDRPKFVVHPNGGTRREDQYTPRFKITQVSGDVPEDFGWRLRGPRFPMDWRDSNWLGHESISVEATFDLTKPPEGNDAQVGEDEIGLETKFLWHGRWGHDLHRWPIERRQLPSKVLWDVKEKAAPSESWDGQAS